MKPEEAIAKLEHMIVSYTSEKGQCSGLTDDEWDEEIDMCQTAIKALKKQIAKKPNNKRFSRNYELAEHNIMEGECHNCGDTITGNSYGNYCGGCGQAIDWRKE